MSAVGLIPMMVGAIIEAGLMAEQNRKAAEAVAVASLRPSPPDVAPAYREARAALEELEARKTEPAPPPPPDGAD